MRQRERWLAAAAGVVAAGAALGAAECVAVVTGPRTAPLVAVGGAVIDAVPEAGKDLAIRLFGTHDKTALLLGTVVLLAAAAAGIGVLALRSARLGALGAAAFGCVGAAAALTRHRAGPAALLPAVVGAVAAALVLRWLIRYLAAPPAVRAGVGADDAGVGADDAGVGAGGGGVGADDGGRAGADRGRRRFLLAAGATAALGAVAGTGGRWLAGLRDVGRERAEVTLPAPVSPAAPLPADLAGAGPTPFVTPAADFYRIDTALVVPQVSVHGWTLRVHGRVARPLTLTWEQFLARPMIERYVTLACVSNEVGGDLIGNALWLGVPLRDLLDEVGPADGADQVVSRSVDGFTAGTPTAVLRDGRDAMLAVGMNGAPLPVAHGFPVRMVVPGLYGYVSATKWLAELEVTSFDAFDAHWVPKGWARRAPVKTGSRIDTPRGGRTLRAGPTVVAGVAWAQHRGIAAVEVRVDGGPWLPARLSGVPSVDTWRQWTVSWDAAPGDHRLTVRATDAAGDPQTDQRRDPAPDGATGLHSVEVTVT
jgi:DMSO/TMAO reductase YedYZ molybdopterin-dependent catalytic subunit